MPLCKQVFQTAKKLILAQIFSLWIVGANIKNDLLD